MIRVLILHNEYQVPGGEEAVVRNESELLRSRGHEVRVARVSNHQIKTFGDRIRTALWTVRSPIGRDFARAQIEEFKPDLVHVHNFFPLLSPAVLEVCQKAGVPSVLTLHNFRILCANGLLSRQGKPCELCLDARSSKPALEHRCYRNSRLATWPVTRMIETHRRESTFTEKTGVIIATSHFSKSRFVRGGIPEGKIVVKPNFVPRSMLPNSSPDRSARTEAPVGLYVGRLSEEKGVRLLLEAASFIPGEIRLAGDGPLRDEVLAAQGARNIRYLGKLDAAGLSRAYAEADYLILPSLVYENFPMAVVEAAAFGLPAVVAGHGGMAEIVSAGETGEHFTPGSSQELGGVVARLVRDPGRIRKLGAAARVGFESKYSEDANYEQLVGIYGELVRSSSRLR